MRSVPAAEIEEAVIAQVRHLLRSPEIIARTWAAAKRGRRRAIPERDVVKTVTDFAPLWDELFPAEQARIVRLLVERIDLVARWHAGAAARRRAADAGRGTAVTGGQRRHERRSARSTGENWEFDGKTITVRIPMTLEAPRRPQGDHRAGRRRRLGTGEAAAGRDADPRAGAGASVEADAGRGQVPSAGELAEAEGVTRSFVNRLLRLTLLAPDISEAILDGRQPKAMQLEELTRMMPSEWEEQREQFFVA